MRDAALFITILCACGVIGYPACLLLPSNGIRARALCAPPVGYGVFAISSNVLYAWGVPTATSLAAISAIGFVATGATLLARHGLSLAVRVRAIGTGDVFATAVVVLVAILCLMPAWTGGTVFTIFQGNVYDQFSYLAATVSFHRFDYASLVSPEANLDVVTGASRWVLSNRPSPPIVYSAFANIWYPNSLSGVYSYLAALQANMMFAALFMFLNVFALGRTLALLLSAALTLGFFQQYVFDLNSWGQLACQPIFLLMMAVCVLAMTPAQFDARPRYALLRIAGFFGVLSSTALYVYPEALAVFAPAGLAPAVLALIATRREAWSSAAVGIAGLTSGVVIAFLAGLLYFHGTIYFLYRQFTGLAVSNVDWWQFFQSYLFGREADYLALLTGRAPASWSMYIDALFSWPVEAAAGAIGLYYILPDSTWPMVLAVAYRLLLYVFMAGLLIGSARAIVRYWRSYPASSQIRMIGACLAGLTVPIVIVCMGQYWSAGKALSMAAPLLFVLLVTPLLFSAFSGFTAKVCSVVFVLAHLGLGIARPIVSADPSGGGILGLPGAVVKTQKSTYDWRHDKWGALMQDCARVAIDVNDEHLGRLVEIVATDRRVAWSSLQSGYTSMANSRKPVRSELIDQADCLVTDYPRAHDGKRLIWVGDSTFGEYLAGTNRNLEIGVRASVKTIGLHPIETTQQNTPLRWTSGNASFTIPNNPADPARRLALALWDIRLDTPARLAVTVNGQSLYEGSIPIDPLDLPLERFAADQVLSIRLQVTPARRAPGDARELGVAIKHLQLLR